MQDISHIPMIPITHQDIIKDNTISWLIKSDLLSSDEIYELTYIDQKQMKNSYSSFIKFIRTYNKKYQPHKKFIFTLYSTRVFYTIVTNKIKSTSNNNYYTDETMQYAYDNR